MISLQTVFCTTTKQQWISMTHDYFVNNIVGPINMMSNQMLSDILKLVPYEQFMLITQKAWEEQDKMPDAQEQHFEDAYQETLPMVLFLEKILTLKIQLERDLTRKNKLGQQLAIVSLILSPHKLESLAQSINDKRTPIPPKSSK